GCPYATLFRSTVLKKVLGSLGWNAGVSAGRVLEEWDDIVGERLATHCRPVSFEDGVRVVSASSSAWAAQAEEEALTTSTPSSKETGRQWVARRSPTMSSHSSSTRPALTPAFQPRLPSTFFSTVDRKSVA